MKKVELRRLYASFAAGRASNQFRAPDVVLSPPNGSTGANLTHFTNTIKPFDQMRRDWPSLPIRFTPSFSP